MIAKRNQKLIKNKPSKVNGKIKRYIFTLIKKHSIALVSLLVSIFSLIIANREYFYSRVFQPLVYNYAFEVCDEKTVINNIEFSLLETNIHAETGYIKKVCIICANDSVENFLSYNSKNNNIPLLNKMTISFPLKFNSFLSCNNCFYQYVFVYIEAANGEWYLDCIVVKYDKNVNIESVLVYDFQDLLRIEYEEDEAVLIILNEYQKLLKSIQDINAFSFS